MKVFILDREVIEDLPELGSASDYARASGFSRQLLAKHCAEGQLKHTLVGRALLIHRADFVAWLKSLNSKGGRKHVAAS